MKRRIVSLFLVVGLLWALFGAAFVSADEPDDVLHGTSSSPSGTVSHTIWSGSVVNYAQLEARFTLEVAAGANVSMRWTCDQGQSSATVTENRAGLTATSGPMTQTIYTSVGQSIELTYCAYHLWSTNGGAFRVTNASIAVWLREGHGEGGVPGATPSPSPSPSPSPDPLACEGDLRSVSAAAASSTAWVAPATGWVYFDWMEINQVVVVGGSNLALAWNTAGNTIAAKHGGGSPSTWTRWESTYWHTGPNALTNAQIATKAWTVGIGLWKVPHASGAGSQAVTNGTSYNVRTNFTHPPYTTVNYLCFRFSTVNPANAEADTDADGHNALDENLAGTDPNDPNDYPGAPEPSPSGGSPTPDPSGNPLPTFGAPDPNDPGNGGNGVPGQGGGNLGGGATGCEPTYPKPGMIEPTAIQSCDFPAFDGDIFGYIGNLLNSILCRVVNLAIIFGNAIGWLFNRVVDFVVPSDCIGDLIETGFTDLQLIEPFATYSEVEAQVKAAISGAGGSSPAWCVPLWDGAGEVCLPLGEWAAVTAPARNVAAVFVWLMGALGVVSIITGSFHVVRAGVSGRSDATVRLDHP